MRTFYIPINLDLNRRGAIPLVHIYHPRNERVHRFPEAFYGIDDDDDIKNQMQSHDGVYTNIY